MIYFDTVAHFHLSVENRNRAHKMLMEKPLNQMRLRWESVKIYAFHIGIID